MNFKKFSNFLIFFKLLGAYSDLLLCFKLIQNISAKPCSLARFFVPGEKNLTFFHFFKSLLGRGFALPLKSLCRLFSFLPYCFAVCTAH